MIEVEKVFILTKEQEEALIKDAEFLGEKVFTDIYYDDKSYSLTTKDLWFRQRDGKFELKVPLNKSLKERVSDQYQELESDQEILKYFNAPDGWRILDFLKEKSYNPFCKITTTRRKYKKEVFNIDFDVMDFGYVSMDIEKMIDDASKMDETTESIIEFAKRHNINESEKWGKVIEYVKRNNSVHFQVLLASKVIC